jgi:class 3 adenylate cyclase
MSQTRRLAAIFAADVAGYSRLMGADEEGTLERLKALRRELLDPKIAEHHGAASPRPRWWNLGASVRRPASRVRITAQLIDATDGAHLWADRSDGSLIGTRCPLGAG